jgi:hypothetical protein
MDKTRAEPTIRTPLPYVRLENEKSYFSVTAKKEAPIYFFTGWDVNTVARQYPKYILTVLVRGETDDPAIGRLKNCSHLNLYSIIDTKDVLKRGNFPISLKDEEILFLCHNIFGGDVESNHKLAESILPIKDRDPGKIHLAFVNTDSNAEIPELIKSSIDYSATLVTEDEYLLSNAFDQLHRNRGVTPRQFQHWLNSVPNRPGYLAIDVHQNIPFYLG